jgi:hypothetical protein
VKPFGSTATCLLLALVWGGPASGQYGPANRYEMQYGDPVDVPLDDLIQTPEPYYGRAVRTTGQLDLLQVAGVRGWALKSLWGRVVIAPVQETAARFNDDALRWVGRDIEITGVLQRSEDPERHVAAPMIIFWTFYGPQEESPKKRPPAEEVTLEDLLRRPGQWDGRTVRVVGQFRGANLFGDLPSASHRKSSDWVIKNDLFAVWVTGKKPEGKGWKLDAKLRRDTGKWIEVEGRVQTFRGVVYISATHVALGKAPSPTAHAEAPPPPPPPPLKPPVVVFSLPLDGERDIPPDTVFKVQFSNDMDQQSFQQRVGVRYAGRPRPGDRVFDAITVTYDIGRRALTVDPGDILRAGRVVELILLPGIVDVDGQPLEPRPGHDPGGAAEVLRFRVAGGTLLSGP